jgi:hypothetical protein
VVCRSVRLFHFGSDRARWGGGQVVAVGGGAFAAVCSRCQAAVDGQLIGRCRVSCRAERASRAGTAISCRRMVLVVAFAWIVEARAPAARVRLNAIAAQTSQAALALNRPDGRCAGGPFFRSAMTCSMTAWPRCAASAWSIDSGGVGEHRVVAVDGEQLALVGRVEVGDAAYDQPCGHSLGFRLFREGGVGHLGDLGVGDPLLRRFVEDGVGVFDRCPRIGIDAGDRRVQAANAGVAAAGALVGRAVGLPHRVIDIDIRQPVGADHKRRPAGQTDQQPGRDRVELADVPEGEPAQERAQRRRRPDTAEQSVRRAVPQHRHVIDAIRAADHPRDQRGDLRCRVRADRAMLADQAMQPGALGQRQHRRKTAVRHEVPVVEHRRDAVTDSHLLDALPPASNRP